MGRGNIYELSQNPDELFNATEYVFNDYAGIEFDYCTTSSDPHKDIAYILDEFKDLGAEIGYEDDIPFIVIDNKVKEAYFKASFDEFKQKATAMTMEDFLNESSVWQLRTLLDDGFSDAVTTPFDEFNTMDGFMRAASGKYYIGNVLYMH